MASTKRRITPKCEGSYRFDPDLFFEQWNDKSSPQHSGDFRNSIIRSFGLKPDDSYQYHAEIAVVTLKDAQQVVDFGEVGGLHSWYLDEKEKELPHPSPDDSKAYASLFLPTNNLVRALTGFRSNAKKGSLREQIAQHLANNLVVPIAPLAVPSKPKSAPKNPYLDLWAWSCENLEWAGPIPTNTKTEHAHHILPVLYHHFGCAVPTHAALSLIAQVAQVRTKPKPIIEVGSGTGYWTFMLRKTFPELTVLPIDNLQSKYRVRWIGDTLVQDGPTHIVTHKGGEGQVLLLVYPIVSEDFTGKMLRAFKGDAVCVAATQNGNGHSAFKGETVADWVKRERPDWEEAARVPLPSFAGKDEALFVFRKRAAVEEVA
ncbi:hypothetical protein EJ05DRAFT_473259 [Pseudovirgaria hyperparasitica]|uniref:Uncharacterized protein n=1 Tax=Pseudovirgaria hyperparasitica TaxID=470096 RepID=A0A6A6WK47_9PEZI|nr:uncharacterized protein EJ05DRAFT_473259 [Pseudovirgaria hyperparasitica]KAF2762351.1 hypothetical protein EJ05DRAFT_473259 [Pseudovirgaria hyperparasitica]